MKKTGFFLTAVLLAAMLVFTGCGEKDRIFSDSCTSCGNAGVYRLRQQR